MCGNRSDSTTGASKTVGTEALHRLPLKLTPGRVANYAQLQMGILQPIDAYSHGQIVWVKGGIAGTGARCTSVVHSLLVHFHESCPKSEGQNGQQKSPARVVQQHVRC